MMVVKDERGNGSGICLRRLSPETFINNGRVLFALVESLNFQIESKTKYRTNHSSCTARGTSEIKGFPFSEFRNLVCRYFGRNP